MKAPASAVVDAPLPREDVVPIKAIAFSGVQFPERSSG